MDHDATCNGHGVQCGGAVVTYNVDAAVDLSEASLADMFQALELANHLVCRAWRGRRCCRPARSVGVRCWCCHDGGAGRPPKAQLLLRVCRAAQLPAEMRIQSSCEGVTHGLATTVGGCVECGESWSVLYRGAVLGGEAARRLGDVSTQMCSAGVDKGLLSLCELRSDVL